MKTYLSLVAMTLLMSAVGFAQNSAFGTATFEVVDGLIVEVVNDDVQIGQLRCFLAVADHRHFTRAARELGLAQPSVSAQVRRLEAELSGELFHRMKGNLTLTPAGEALLPFARRILADVDAATSELSEVGGMARGRLAIGATPSLAATLVPPVL